MRLDFELIKGKCVKKIKNHQTSHHVGKQKIAGGKLLTSLNEVYEMNIPENSCTCKRTSAKPLSSIDIGTGNIVPHWWYQKILTTGDKADTIGISLLSELWFLYRSTGKQQHQKDYSYFCNKFSLSQYQVREAFIRLEALKLMKRTIGSIKIGGRKLGNILFVSLNVDTLLSLAPTYSKSSNNKANNDYNNYHEEVEANDNCSLENNSLTQGSNFSTSRVRNSKDFRLRKNEARYIKKEIIRNRSTRSIKSNFVKKKISPNSVEEEQKLPHAYTASKERLSFASFYPLAKADVNTLQMLCGREFSVHAINEILQNIGIKLPNHTFPHKAAFIKYMGKALTHELRDAVKISNENFRIAGNVTAEEAEIKLREAYLAEIENSKDTTRPMQLKRKLAGALSPNLAYNFLSLARFENRDAEETSAYGEHIKIYLSKKLELSEVERQIILKEVQSVYGEVIQKLDIQMPDGDIAEGSGNINAPKLSTKEVKAYSQPQTLPQLPPPVFEGIWGQIRQSLIEHYGARGAAIDNAWFSKLSADIDQVDKKLTLRAPTKFIRDWVQNNYLRMIAQICSKQNYYLMGVSI